MLTASIVIDLTAPGGSAFAYDSDRRDAHAVARAELADAPDGTRVLVLVGGRQRDLTSQAVAELHRHLRRLHIDIRGSSSSAILRWHRAICSGQILEVAP